MSGLTDRELLDGAARAAGIVLKWSSEPDMPPRDNTWHNWNPLADDGDALRLAVRLEFDVDIRREYSRASNKGFSVSETNHGDPLSATRRAIVRAAYEIGSART